MLVACEVGRRSWDCPNIERKLGHWLVGVLLYKIIQFRGFVSLGHWCWAVMSGVVLVAHRTSDLVAVAIHGRPTLLREVATATTLLAHCICLFDASDSTPATFFVPFLPFLAPANPPILHLVSYIRRLVLVRCILRQHLVKGTLFSVTPVNIALVLVIALARGVVALVVSSIALVGVALGNSTQVRLPNSRPGARPPSGHPYHGRTNHQHYQEEIRRYRFYQHANIYGRAEHLGYYCEFP